jgi:hypothetical protein
MNRTYFSFESKILSGRENVRTKFFLAVLVVLFASCKKESDIGIDIQPEEDIIGLFTTDTTTLLTYTVREDSIRTDETPTVVLGKYNDVIFGESTCGVYSQLSIPNNLGNITFQSAGFAILDSAVLMLSYKIDYYGDTLTPQKFDVYQMTDMIYKDSIYYSNQTRSCFPGAIGSLTFNPKPRTEVIVNGDTVPAHVRIPMDLNWAQQIFNQSGGANLASQASWQAYMNGIYISPGAMGGGLLYFNMLDSLTGLRLYYHTATSATSFTFVVNSTTAYHSHYQHNYNTADLDIQAQLTNPAAGPWTKNYVQSNAGLKTRIEFPFLDNYKNLGYPIAINKAELVIEGDPGISSDFPLNTRMFLTSIDSVGKEHLLIDMFESSSYYGGSLNTTTNQYRINIARYIQGVLSGEEENNGLYLKEIFGTENGRRSVIGSGDASATNPPRMYLRLVYTRIN